MKNEHDFDFSLACDCASSFSISTNLGAIITSLSGETLASFGYSCDSCTLCKALGKEKEDCINAQSYGLSSAERFGGKYIYYCPMGLTCFVSPILGESKSQGKITVGPFLMVGRQDFIDCELSGLDDKSPKEIDLIHDILYKIPVVSPKKVDKMSSLLFMSVGFLNNVSRANNQRQTQDSDHIQGQIASYINHIKSKNNPPYPIEKERALLSAIRKGERQEANRLLNELQGHIFFQTGQDLELIKARLYELLILMGRSAIDGGANQGEILSHSRQSLKTLPSIKNIDNLCLWLSKETNYLLDSVFLFSELHHSNIIHSCVQYIEENYFEDISLEILAKRVFLSQSYLSRIFKKELNTSFTEYLNKVRIDHSKILLSRSDLKLIDVSNMVGFQDQSYFTKVFKKFCGETPLKFKAKKPVFNSKQ